jgi:hypothetical protein
MKRFIGITLAGAVLAAIVGPRGPLGGFWAPSPHVPRVDGALQVGFITWHIVETLAFGVGLAILLLGRNWFNHRTTTPGRATTVWLSAAWLFASWMPHAALHQHIGMQPTALLTIEWVFHGGAILAIATLLWAVFTSTPGQPTDAMPTLARSRITDDEVTPGPLRPASG